MASSAVASLLTCQTVIPEETTFRAGHPTGHPKGVAMAAVRLPQRVPLCAPAGLFASSQFEPRYLGGTEARSASTISA